MRSCLSQRPGLSCTELRYFIPAIADNIETVACLRWSSPSAHSESLKPTVTSLRQRDLAINPEAACGTSRETSSSLPRGRRTGARARRQVLRWAGSRQGRGLHGLRDRRRKLEGRLRRPLQQGRLVGPGGEGQGSGGALRERPRAGGSTGAGEPVFEQLWKGEIRVSPYVFTQRSKTALIDNLAILFEKRKITLPLTLRAAPANVSVSRCD